MEGSVRFPSHLAPPLFLLQHAPMPLIDIFKEGRFILISDFRDGGCHSQLCQFWSQAEAQHHGCHGCRMGWQEARKWGVEKARVGSSPQEHTVQGLTFSNGPASCSPTHHTVNLLRHQLVDWVRDPRIQSHAQVHQLAIKLDHRNLWMVYMVTQ